MAKLKLRPWKFKKDEKVRLHWICSPYKNENGNWTVRAVFVADAAVSLKIFGDEVEIVSEIDKYKVDYHILEFPWGLLPNLRVGRTYVNGIVENVSPIISTKKISVPNLRNGEICEAFDLPIRFYNFFKNRLLGKEKLWRFQVGEITYFLPCLEIIRAFLASSKTLTNQILKPNGFNSLITEEYRDFDTLSVKLSPEIPRSILNQETIMHLLWIYCDKLALNAWKSVYIELYAKAIGNYTNPTRMFAKGLPLEVKPPISEECQLYFTCTTWEKSCLIHEILTIGGFPPLPFSNIKYSHPSYKSHDKSDKNKAKRKVYSAEINNGLAQDSGRRAVKTQTKQPLAEMSATRLSFAKLPKLKRNSIDRGVIADGTETLFKGDVPLGKPVLKDGNETVGTDESYIGGEITPVEFIGLRMVKSEDYTGLEDFKNAINFLQVLNPRLSVNFNTYNVPGNSSFCTRDDGEKRNFALVRVIQDNVQPAYLLELARPDEWDVSTLILQFHPKIKKQEKMMDVIESTVKDMVKNNGHWQIETLEQSVDFRFARIKHFQESSAKLRAERLNTKLWDIGFR
jgi:TnsE C-terminal domain